MRYRNLHFTYQLTYLLTYSSFWVCHQTEIVPVWYAVVRVQHVFSSHRYDGSRRVKEGVTESLAAVVPARTDIEKRWKVQYLL